MCACATVRICVLLIAWVVLLIAWVVILSGADRAALIYFPVQACARVQWRGSISATAAATTVGLFSFQACAANSVR